MRRKKGSVAEGVIGFIFLGAIAIVAGYWYIALPVGVGIIALIIHLDKSKKIAAYKESTREKVYSLYKKLEKDIDYATNGKSLKTRLNNCDDALNVLQELEDADKEFNLIPNKNDLREKLSSLKRMLPVIKLLSKRSKQAFLRENKKEIKLLNEIQYYIQVNNISQADFDKVKIIDETSNETISLEFIDRRLRDLSAS